MFAANDLELLEENRISHILVAANGLRARYPSKFRYHKIPAEDEDSYNIAQHFQDAIKFIHEAHTTGGTVLVHCIVGQSRSASLVIAYLMATQKLSSDEALQFVKERRRLVNPNRGFLTQLKKFEEKAKLLQLPAPANGDQLSSEALTA